MAGAGTGGMVSGTGYAQQGSERTAGRMSNGLETLGRGRRLVAAALSVLIAIACVVFAIRWVPIGFATNATAETIPMIDEEECWNASRIVGAADRWPTLSKDERLEAVQVMVDRESHELALPLRQMVVSGNLKPNVMGEHEGSTITIDEDALTDDEMGLQVLEVAGHETYHAYQHAIVDGSYGDNDGTEPYPDQSTIDQWRWEFDHYQTSGGAYFTQQVEISARQYGREAVERLRQDALKEVA